MFVFECFHLFMHHIEKQNVLNIVLEVIRVEKDVPISSDLRTIIDWMKKNLVDVFKCRLLMKDVIVFSVLL